MKTPDETKTGLVCCSKGGSCYGCQYNSLGSGKKCIPTLCADALAYIKQLEQERDALAKLYKPHSTCGSCKHKDSTLCDVCTSKNNLWEWRG